MDALRSSIVLLATGSLAWALPIAADDSLHRGFDLRGSASFSSDWGKATTFGDSSLSKLTDKTSRQHEILFPEATRREPARGSEQVPIECDLPPLPGTLGAMGCELWVSRYDGPGTGIDDSYWVIPSPDGSKVFVAGVSVAK